MTADEFNEKYKDFLEPRFYGLAIDRNNIVRYLDKEFEKEIKVNPDFTYAQIKLKFGNPCVYAETIKCAEWEDGILKRL